MTEAEPPGVPRIAVVGLVLDDAHAEEMDRMRTIYSWALRTRDIARPAPAPAVGTRALAEA